MGENNYGPILVYIIIKLFCIMMILQIASEKKESKFIWFVRGLIVPVIALIWLSLLKEKKTNTYDSIKTQVHEDRVICPYCSEALLKSERFISGEEIDLLKTKLTPEQIENANNIKNVYGDFLYKNHMLKIANSLIYTDNDLTMPEVVYLCHKCNNKFSENTKVETKANISNEDLQLIASNFSEDEIKQAKEIKRIYGDSVYYSHIKEMNDKRNPAHV